MTKKVLITGITGQDGSYLAELLLSKGYEVHGVVRRVAQEHPEHRLWRIRHILDRVHLHAGSMESFASVHQVFSTVMPDECYHLAAQSFVSYSFEDEFSTMMTNINGTHYMLATIKQLRPDCRFYFAGSSEMFGHAQTSPQSESTPFHPRSVYGISKVTGFDLTRNYREAYNLHASCGISYNHESPRRGYEFVSRKITSHVAQIKLGQSSELRLGNLDAMRDWGHAQEYVTAMWAMLQQEAPDDYVVGTGESHSVREFAERAFSVVGLDYQRYVVVDQALFRPTEVFQLQGDASKAASVLDWRPTITFGGLVEDMVTSDLKLCQDRTGAAEAQPAATPEPTAFPTPVPTVTPMPAITPGPTPIGTATPLPPADTRYGVVVHTSDVSFQEFSLNTLQAEWFLDYGRSTGPAGFQKVISVMALPGPSAAEVQALAAQAPGAVWYVVGEPNRQAGYLSDADIINRIPQFQALYTSIKAADPTALITSPSVLNWAFTCNGCGGYRSGQDWMTAFLRQYKAIVGSEPPIDIWAIDVYPLDWLSLPTVDASIPIDQISGMRDHLNTLPAHSGKPIWVTEMALHWGWSDLKFVDGLPTPCGTYQTGQVLEYFQTLFDWLEANSSGMNIQRWFTFSTYMDIAQGSAESYAGVTLFDGPGVGASLTPVGQYLKSRILGTDQLPSGYANASLPC